MTQMFAPQSTGWAGTRRGAPKVGASATLTRVVTRHDIAAFAGMTGDRNPIHFDDVLASATQLGRPVVQGGVSSGLLNALVATHLPGPGTVFLGVRWRFPRPVHPGERITARVEVLSVREDKPICSLATIVSNEAGKTVIEGDGINLHPAASGSFLAPVGQDPGRAQGAVQLGRRRLPRRSPARCLKTPPCCVSASGNTRSHPL
jgi:acyl dehydratase